MNYTELSSALQEYLQNTEESFVARIPGFVAEAEQRIYRNVSLPDFRRNLTGNLNANDRFLVKPPDFLAPLSFAVKGNGGDYEYLLSREASLIREAYPSILGVGFPKYYAEWDDEYFVIGPTPDQSYDVLLYYIYDPESIVTAGTTWLGDNASGALLYGSLLEAYVYEKGDKEMLAVYKERYDEAIARLQELGGFRNKRDSYRDGEPRIET